MATTQTTKRRTAATKRSTTGKKSAATRAQKSAVNNASRAKTNAKRRVNQPSTSKQVRPLIAQAEFVGSIARNAVQTGVTAGSKVAATVTRKVADIL